MSANKVESTVLYHLWYGDSGESEEVIELLERVHFPFVPVPVSGTSRPELVVGIDSFEGIEKIKSFLKTEGFLK